jgi:hypothetical protein
LLTLHIERFFLDKAHATNAPFDFYETCCNKLNQALRAIYFFISLSPAFRIFVVISTRSVQPPTHSG